MNTDLTHHGIKGMRWGVRRTTAQLLRRSGSSKKAADLKNKKTVKTMSDDELRKAVNRLQLEKQYSQLSEGSVSRGKQYAQNVFKAGTTIAAVTTTGLTIYNNANKIKDIIEKVRT